MKISVIVPTYKPQAYLWECLDSIYNQTFPKSDYELVLVLNGCNEPYNTQILDWLSKHKDLNVQFFQIDTGGVSNARNIALDNARGEYVTFIDDDDLISTAYLKELYEKATPDTVSLCYPYAFNDGDIEKQLPYSITKAYDYICKNKYKKLSSMRACQNSQYKKQETRCTFLCGCTTSFCFSTKKSLINNLYGVIWVK